MIAYLWIGLGSALGGIARHGVASWMTARFPSAFPWGTLAVNVAGSILIGFIASLPTSKLSGVGDEAARQFLTIGFLGGFTTFSAFSMQTVTLMQHGKGAAALGYVLLSVVLCVGGAAVGYACATGGFGAKP